MPFFFDRHEKNLDEYQLSNSKFHLTSWALICDKFIPHNMGHKTISDEGIAELLKYADNRRFSSELDVIKSNRDTDSQGF